MTWRAMSAGPWLRDQVATMFVAGSDTTAVSVSWTLHHLASNPVGPSKHSPHLKPSLRPPWGPEGPHVIGRESGLLRCDWLDLLDQI